MKASECKYEVWKPIHNFNNYEVSTFGRIRSIPRKVHTWYGERKVKGKILNTFISVREAGRHLNLNPSCISKCCKGKIKTYKNYFFCYE